jgi:thiamine pyrophosphate-dependent acetolactate synthase large subunit-like protein
MDQADQPVAQQEQVFGYDNAHGTATVIRVGPPDGLSISRLPAASCGVESERVKSPPDLTHATTDALSSDRPHLIEISQRRLANS